MGTRNAQLILACERARATLDFLSKCVDESQAECPHPPERRKKGPGRGEALNYFCLDCSKGQLGPPKGSEP